MKPLPLSRALKSNRPTLGNILPLSLWRTLRLNVLPDMFGNDVGKINRALGLKMGGLLAISEPKDLVKVIQLARIGVCKSFESRKGFYAIEFNECITCSGITPPIGEPICDFEKYIIMGAFLKMGYKVKKVDETKCMGGLGDLVCRIELKV